MTLSICIPTFNRLSYLKELLPAVLSQADGIGGGDVEVLVSNNCSTDGTAAYLESLSSPSLRFWTNETNIGGDRNFLKCISEAKGEYVWLVGDDDIIENSGVALILDVLRRDIPDLLIADESDRNEKVFSDYRACLLGESDRKTFLALSHTLISANVFRRELFDFEVAKSRLWTSYAHMFGFIGNVKGKVVLSPGVLRTREERAEFEKYPSFLCVKHAIYLWYLAKRFALPSYRWCAVKSVCNLPLEFGSRVKYYLKKVLCGGRKAVCFLSASCGFFTGGWF